jgi:hypothetical protein
LNAVLQKRTLTSTLVALSLSLLAVVACDQARIPTSKVQQQNADFDGSISNVRQHGHAYSVPIAYLDIWTKEPSTGPPTTYGFIVSAVWPDMTPARSANISSDDALRYQVSIYLSNSQLYSASKQLELTEQNSRPSAGRVRAFSGEQYGLRVYLGPNSFEGQLASPPMVDFQDQFVPLELNGRPSQGFLLCTSYSHPNYLPPPTGGGIPRYAARCTDHFVQDSTLYKIRYSRDLLPRWREIRDRSIRLVGSWRQD